MAANWLAGVFPTPWTIEKIKPKLKVYGGENPLKITIKHDENVATALNSNGFLDVDRLIFIVHGFMNTGDEPWMKNMKRALTDGDMEDQTVVIVAWRGGANLNVVDYCQASSNTRTVGKWLGRCVKEIKRKKPNIYVHGIGHSLGAHVLGMAGRESGQFDRISGLDPAGPDFEQGSFGHRNGLRGLRESDARHMVDVIHTDCHNPSPITVGPNHYGTFEPMGTVDFYPNYGYMQPGTPRSLSDLGGSHERAIELFVWTIKNKGKLTTDQEMEEPPRNSSFSNPGCRTSRSKVEMGYYADRKNPTGLWYIKTTDRPPWK